VAIGLSTSGTSPNVLAALSAAQNSGMTAAAFGGREGGGLSAVADPVLIVPSDSTARIQEMHSLLGHMLCGALERELGLGDG
jgi:D-sedoheptulose 7-phosphate isomerase